MTIDTRSYDITPRPAHLGGGWKLTFYQDGQEAGGGVFPVSQDDPEGKEAYLDAQEEGESWVCVNGH